MTTEGEQEILIAGSEENPVVRINQIAGECHKLLDASTVKVIEDEFEHSEADKLLVVVQRKIKEVDGVRTSMTKPLLETKRRIDTLFEKPLIWLRTAEENIKSAIADYRSLRDATIEQERAKAAQLLADSQKKVEEALTSGKPEEAAAAIMQQAELAVSVQAAAPVVEDLNPTYTTWKYSVNDFMGLVKEVAAGRAPQNFLMVNDSVVGKYVRDLKEHAVIPGCTCYPEKTVRGRGGRK